MAAPTPIDQDLTGVRQALARGHTQIVVTDEQLTASELKCQKYYKEYSYIHVQGIKRVRKVLEEEKIHHSTRVRDLEWEGGGRRAREEQDGDRVELERGGRKGLVS